MHEEVTETDSKRNLSEVNSLRSWDTSIDAERTQLQVVRSMRPERRLHLGLELTKTCRRLMVEGVRIRHPEYDGREIMLAVFRLELGDRLFLAAYPHAAHIVP